MPKTANPYEQDVDFTALAVQDPDFNKQYVYRALCFAIVSLVSSIKANGQLDFSNPQSVKYADCLHSLHDLRS